MSATLKPLKRWPRRVKKGYQLRDLHRGGTYTPEAVEEGCSEPFTVWTWSGKTGRPPEMFLSGDKIPAPLRVVRARINEEE